MKKKLGKILSNIRPLSAVLVCAMIAKCVGISNETIVIGTVIAAAFYLGYYVFSYFPEEESEK